MAADTRSFIEKSAAIFLALGATVTALIALQWKAFELDRYFVPKELALHVAVLLAGGLLALRKPAIKADAADWLFGLFLAWSAVSALFATNHWLAQRALAVSVSSALVFWCARSLHQYRRWLLAAVATAATAAAMTSLLQAYGYESEYFTLARSPGGTLGNRNFVAHLSAIALPSALWVTVTARRQVSAAMGYAGISVLAAALVLSRSRAAWLAVATCVLVTLVPLLMSRRHWGSKLVGGRLARSLLAMAIGGLLAIVLPNKLNWKSDSPYLDTARNVADYTTGSGRGRIAQYRNSLEMTKDNPVLGVGPGNWPVRYVRYAPRGDKSLAASGMTANPWPSSDWVAFLSERGVVATVALMGLFASLFLAAIRGWRDLPDGDTVLAKVALTATLVSTMVVSAFDAVLLLPASAYVAWVAIGAAAGERRSREMNISPRVRRWVGAALMVMVLVAVTRSSMMVTAMWSVGRGGTTAGWVKAAIWDPGSYRINQRVAELYLNRGRCARARPFARRALGLFPHAAAPQRVLRRCG